MKNKWFTLEINFAPRKTVTYPRKKDIHFLFSKAPANAHSHPGSEGKTSVRMDGSKRLMPKPAFREELLSSGKVSLVPSRQHVDAEQRPLLRATKHPGRKGSTSSM